MIKKTLHFIYIALFILTLFAPSIVISSDSVSSVDSLSIKKNDWISGWKKTSSMIAARTGAAIYHSDKYVYMIGGLGFLDKAQQDASDKRRPGYLRTSEYARINSDGSLSSWQSGPNLNVERGYFAVIQHKNYLYAVGGGRGMNGKELLSSIERAEIKEDGTLSEWTMEKSILNIPRRCVKLAVIGNTVYAFGGYGGILLDTVEQADINPDGTLDEWLVATDPMIVARYVHGKVTVGDGVYNIGGHSKAGGEGITDVGWSKVDEDGFFLPWEKKSPLQTGRYALATVLHNGSIYAIGGLTGPASLNSIERSKILGEGELSSWTYTTPTPFGIGGANAIVIKDKVYLLGGSDGLTYLDNVFYAGFNEKGDIGYMGSAADLAQHKADIASREKSKIPLPHEGVVLQHFKQKLYSYLQVREDNNSVLWLAAPAKDIKVGDRIGYPNGTLMKNFYSKGLEKRFAFILFISQTRILNKETKQKVPLH